jgi:glucosamine-phosphate N-acetyltransferase
MDGKIVGTVTLLIETKLIHNMGKVAHIEDVVVDKNYRNNGLGKQMIQYAVSLSKEYGCYKTILDCSDENVSFYQKCDFEKRDNMMAIYF